MKMFKDYVILYMYIAHGARADIPWGQNCDKQKGLQLWSYIVSVISLKMIFQYFPLTNA